MLLPGIELNNSPDDHALYHNLRFAGFDGTGQVLFGDASANGTNRLRGCPRNTVGPDQDTDRLGFPRSSAGLARATCFRGDLRRGWTPFE
jgi:hypothetical protein